MVEKNQFIWLDAIYKALSQKVEMYLLPLQPGDVPDTYADVESLVDWLGYKPGMPVEEGVARFVEWYAGFYRK